MIDTSIVIAEAVSGKRVAFRKSSLSDNDQNFGEQRYVEQISIVGERFYSPPEWEITRGFYSPYIDTPDTADVTNLPEDLLINALQLLEKKTIYVSVGHVESAGECDITPIIFDAGKPRSNGTSYLVGEFINVGMNNSQGIDIMQCYECTTAGTSATEDTFDWSTLGYGDTHEDGTCVWTCRYSGRIVGQLEKKTATASTLRRGSSSGLYLSPVLTWEVCGAWFAGIHITALSQSNEVEIIAWAL